MRRINVGSFTPWIIFELRRSQVLPWVIYLVDCVLRTRIYRSSIPLDLRRSLELPRRRSTSDRWIPALFLGLRHVAGFPALSVDLRRVAGFPALFISLRYVAGNTRAFWISRAFCRLRRVAGIPALSSICEIKPRSPASTISRVFHAGAILSSSSASLDWIYLD